LIPDGSVKVRTLAFEGTGIPTAKDRPGSVSNYLLHHPTVERNMTFIEARDTKVNFIISYYHIDME
jgi:hypothetical protein